MQAVGVSPLVRGYLYVLVQNIQTTEPNKDVSCHISLGAIARCSTTVKKSGTAWNQVFMIEVPSDPTRLILQLKEGQANLGDCRYDVNPFFEHPGASHAINSDFIGEKGDVIGNISIKVTYYSAEFGKLKIRVFHLSLAPQFVEKFKHAKLKIKIGVFAQSSPIQDLDKQFDHTLQLLILAKNANLIFEVTHEEGILATYTLYDIQKSNLLLKEQKAYQVSLFNGDKAVGTIKYLVEWIQPKP